MEVHTLGRAKQKEDSDLTRTMACHGRTSRQRGCWWGQLVLLAFSAVLGGRAEDLVATTGSEEVLLNLTMPDYEIKKDDMYLCTTVALPAQPMKLVGILPRARMDVVHHILLFGCKQPYQLPTAANPRPVWECNGLPTCADGGYNIMYGWGRNAPDLKLPAGVGFSVGADTGIQWVVAQVHYLSKLRPKEDHSGVTLVLQPQAVPFSAGVIAFAAGFIIPPGKPSYLVENECCYRGYEPLTTFAMRVHTHALGRKVYMTRETWNHSGIERVSEGDPQLPQAFYPVQRHTIWPGDRLKVTCDFDSSNKATPTNAGGMHNDEMCNMYMMVFGWHPFINMCAGGFGSGQNPGVMSQKASFIPDASPFWQPPDPQTSELGEMTSLVTAADGALWGLYRGDRVWDGNTFDANNVVTAMAPIKAAVVVRMDADTGKVLSAWGADTFYMPHMLTIDQEGNVWVVDVGLHQVLKFSPAGHLLLTLGHKLTPGSGKDKFCMPTKVAILRDGTIFVSDGYCNSRVVKFSKDGTYLAEVEVQGGQVIHYVLADECQNLVYAASRETGVVLAYDIATLELKSSFHQFGGRVWSLAAKPYGGVLALVWDDGKVAKLVDVDSSHAWPLPGLDKDYPHEVTFGPAPLALSGAGERLHAAYVVPTCPPPQCGKLQRLVLLPDGRRMPNAKAIAAIGPQPLPTFPPVANLALPGKQGSGALVSKEEQGSSAQDSQQVADTEEEVDETAAEMETDEEEQEAEIEEEEKEDYEEEKMEEEEEAMAGDEEGEEVKAAADQEDEEMEAQEEEELAEEEEAMVEEEEQEEVEAEEAAEEEALDEEEQLGGEGADETSEGENEEDYEEEGDLEDDSELQNEGSKGGGAVKGAGGDEAMDYEEGDYEEGQGEGWKAAEGGEKGEQAAKGEKEAVADFIDLQKEEKTSVASVVLLLVVAAVVAAVVVMLALYVMRKFVAPSAAPGSAGQNTGFQHLKTKEPARESIEDMLKHSGSLDFHDDQDVEHAPGVGHRQVGGLLSSNGKAGVPRRGL